ncbi:glycosyltransferase [Hazenella sp. IB182357]|uniref:Glycosyltransferase n=1 Tax=Polycladospora coralii TaxID=2771432 RepID=A0A926RTN3_9BACL|nr:glycosyltransferase [Polycladospora coralii]
MKKPRLLIASVIKGHLELIKESILSLIELETEGIEIEYLFINEAQDIQIDRLLGSIYHTLKNVYIMKYDVSDKRRQQLHEQILQYAREKKYDQLFLVEPNLTFHPTTLKQLMRVGKDAIGPIIWKNKLEPKQPNVMGHGLKLNDIKFNEQLKRAGVYPVRGISSCILLSKTALESDIMPSSIEDQEFLCHDHMMYVDTNLEVYPILEVADLPGVQTFKKRCRDQMASQQPVTISLCMIVRDEEAVLERCLSPLADIVDEIVIVDTGSVDQTKEIAKKFTSCLYDFKWIDDFAAARNYAFQQATKEYLFWLDADDVLSKTDLDKLRTIKATFNRAYDAVSMEYEVASDDTESPLALIRRNRMVRRSRNFKWHGYLHENLEVAGNILHTDIRVKHRKIKSTPGRNLKIYQNHLDRGEELELRDLFFYANELRDHKRFEEAIIHYEKYINSKQGDPENCVYACLRMAEGYFKMQEPEKALASALKSLHYDTPRAEACSRIGFYFFANQKYQEAIYWFELVLTLEKPEHHYGNVEISLCTWYPHLKLGECYEHLKEYTKAKYHYDEAFAYHPQNDEIIEKRECLNMLMQRSL